MKQTKKGRLEANRKRRRANSAGPAGAGSEVNTGTDKPGAENNQYYIMTREEAEALVRGDMKTVERWVNNLDRNRATWLLRWLIKKEGKEVSAETPE